MANQCPNCNKFVSIGYDVEMANDPYIEEQSNVLQINATYIVKRVCVDCGTELACKEVESIEHTNKKGFEDS